MANIKIRNMDFYYDTYFTSVFQDVSIDIETSWRLGLVGRNGRGKTTLLKLLNGELLPTKGSIEKSVKTDIFPFYLENTKGSTLEVIKRCIAPFDMWENKMICLEQKISKQCSQNDLHEYGLLLDTYTENHGFIIDSLIKKEMNCMDLNEELLYRAYATLSEGEKIKVQIISLFLKKDHFLLFDEPTNNLDINGKKTVIEYMRKKTGFIVISHDRYFLNNVVDHILSINKNNIYIERGNYESWFRNKELKDEYERQLSTKLTREIAGLENKSKRNRVWANKKEKIKPKDRGNYKKAQSSSLMKKALIADKRIVDSITQKRELLKNIEVKKDLIFTQSALEDEKYLELNSFSVSYLDRKIIDPISFTLNKGDRIWIKGKNGSGKSTLLREILKKINIQSSEILISNGIQMSYVEQTVTFGEKTLSDIIAIVDNKEVFTQLLIDFNIDTSNPDKKLNYCSEGEKKKVAIAKSLSSNNNILVWDEPLNFIDIISMEQIEKAILEFLPTMIFVEHDSTFGENIATKIIELAP